MSAYYLHDGRNEIGPFTIDLLKQQKLTRSTPIRKLGTDSWMPAERLAPLKELVVPRKIRRPKDVIPAVKEHFTDLHQRKPRTLYAFLFLFFLVAGVSIYTVTRIIIIKEPVSTVAAPQLTVTSKPPAVEVVAQGPSKPDEAPAPVAEDKAKITRQRWNKLISASNSNYGIGFLGGIKDLSVVLTNRTDFPIDLAIVKVSYLKPNGSVWKTIPVTLRNVPPHDSKEHPMPDVSRGKKVKVTIQKIVSKQMNFQYTEGQKRANADDPYVM